MKYIKQKCHDCNKDLGFKENDGLLKRCRSCRTKFINLNPSGKPHKNRAKFRKNTYQNVNYDDRIEEFSQSGNGRKKYRMTCIQCGFDRGYQRQVDALRLCKTCRDSNIRKYTKEQKRLRSCMKANLVARLKQRLINKNKKSTFDILPYTIDDLIKHLESKFYPNPETGEAMTWENYGQWHIDHRTPDSWFEYNSFNDDDFKKSWALENLQPMWAGTNLSKGNRYEG